MQEQFKQFCENIRLTEKQEEDAKRKYDGVCETLHNYYYPNIKYDGTTKFLFGSYKKKTNIRPLNEEQDVDVIFKMPTDEFERYNGYDGNGQSSLLQKIREILKERYTTTETIKGWGKVVLVRFTDGTHNVEVLPAWEINKDTFKIPNTAADGCWEPFSPKKDIEEFKKSNTHTNGLTANLTRMLKKWKREVVSVSIKSYEIENYVIDFLDDYNFGLKRYSEIIKDFFEYLENNIEGDNISYVRTAKQHARKAIDFENKKQLYEASEEWRRIFGSEFPSYRANKEEASQNYEDINIVNPSKPWKLR